MWVEGPVSVCLKSSPVCVCVYVHARTRVRACVRADLCVGNDICIFVSD